MAASTHAFEQLLEFKWRDIPFPTSTFELEIKQDLASHKYPGRDGANVEGTGRDAIQFSATIPFRNGLYRGKGETWDSLYPDQYRAFLAAMSDRTTGALQHPDMGVVNCKPVDVKAVWSPDRRDGVDVQASWIETTEIVRVDTSTDAAISIALEAANGLDSQNLAANVVFPSLPAYTPDFAATMRSITAVTDQISLLSQRQAGRIDAIAYRVETLSDSIDRAGSSLLWPMRQSVERMRAALPDLRKILGATGQKLIFYVTPVDTTLAGVANDVGASVSQIISLNRELVREPIVPARTIVRYYKKAA